MKNGNPIEPIELPAVGRKTFGHAASDFEEFSDEELHDFGLAPGKKGLGVPALYKTSHAYVDGLRPGDIILSLDRRWFESIKNFDNYIQAKTDLGIKVELLRNGNVLKLKTTLNDIQDLGEECRTIEELEEKADFGDPYGLLRARGLLRKMHWDYLGLDNLQTARNTAESHQRSLLVGLFGSSMCCVHLAFWTAPYKSMIADASVQNAISKHVSLLIMKPEAYRLYRQHRIDSKFPALVKMSNKDDLKANFTLRPETKVSEVLSFLQNM